MYILKEIFYTLQGEGRYTGRPAIFMRFAGCNLWTGHEKHRISAICTFCDTDFVGTDGPLGGKYTTEQLIAIIFSLWPDHRVAPFLVCTGGEPAMQMDQSLVDALHQSNCFISIETNGTMPLPAGMAVSTSSEVMASAGIFRRRAYAFPGTPCGPLCLLRSCRIAAWHCRRALASQLGHRNQH